MADDMQALLDKAGTLNNTKILLTADAKARTGYRQALASISGGADSDIMLDVLARTWGESPLSFCFFDTGIEFQATKEHLAELERKYGIEIKRYRSKVPVPLAVKQYGHPFLEKRVSMFIGRLQQHGFRWEDEPYEVLKERYPGCESALRWWCNAWGEGSAFNISTKPYLKEFIMANPPTFLISDKCCQKAKKDVAHEVVKALGADLNIVGVRRSEGGIRAYRYKNCFTPESDTAIAQYRPLFFMDDNDKRVYEENFGVTHSRCYTEYGLKRTGCAGCPFGSRFEEELEIIRKHEPKLYAAVMNIFGPSYEYTRAYRAFKQARKAEKRTSAH